MKTLILGLGAIVLLFGGSLEARDGHFGGGRFGGGLGRHQYYRGWNGSGWGYVPYDYYGDPGTFYGSGYPVVYPGLYGVFGQFGYAGPNGYRAPNGYGGPYGYPFDNPVWWDYRFHHPYQPY